MKRFQVATLPEKYQKLKLGEIAEKINAHLRRMAADPAINVEIRPGYHQFYEPWAGRSGNRCFVTYVAYQGPTGITKSQAIRYLASLDNGYVGRHFELEKRV